MLDIKLIREDAESAKASLARRGGFDLSEIIKLDGERLELIGKAEELKRTRNEMTRDIGKLRKSGGNADELMEKSRAAGDEIKECDNALKVISEKIDSLILSIPNLPHASVPDGAGEADNVEVRRWGTIPEFDFEPKSHAELGESLGIIDSQRAVRMSGARFSLFRGQGARLERALISFMLDIHTREHGYTEISPPYMVNTAAMTGTGQLPKFADDLFKIEGSDYWLIPTAEVPLTNIHAGEILDGGKLPIAMTAYTPCFRAEAGSYGKDTTGLIRQHQFSKVELVVLAMPDDSESMLEKLTSHAEEILKRLNLPYRVVNLCVGDLGFSAVKTYDLEVWVPSQNKYREISSCSWFHDFQARRINTRFKREKKGKPELVHTLNGSGLAVGRTMVAILENFQSEDGSVEIPDALRPYMNGDEIITL